MVKRITPNIRSGNPAVGQEFYTDLLGLEVVTDIGWVVTPRFAGKSNCAADHCR